MRSPLAGLRLDRRALLAALPGLVLAPPALAGELQVPPVDPALQETTEAWLALKAWTDEYGRPTAQVMINGQGPFDFLVDTGSNTTVVAMKHAIAVGARFEGMVTVHGTTGSSDLPVATLDTLETGAVDKEAIRVAVLPDGALGADGIIGADVFQGKRLSFDISGKRVRVESSRFRARTGSRVVTFGDLRIRNGMLAELPGFVGRIRTRLMIDTGAQTCILNMPLNAALRRGYPRQRRVERVTVKGVTGHIVVGEFVELPEVALGTLTVVDASAVAADAPIFDLWGLTREPAMIVGVDVLSRLSGFTIDYGTRSFDAKPLSLIAGDRLVAQT